jgi:chemotaxis protein MotB
MGVRRVRCAAAVVIGLLSACGYSEDEWKAQLARYGQLNDQYDAEKKSHEQTRAELEAAKQKVAGLTAELSRLGVDVENLSRQLEAQGTEKERLSADLSEMQRALDEYKSRAAQLERIRNRFEELRQKLQKLTKFGLKVEVRHNRQVISLPGDLLFPSGKDTLKEGANEVLDVVAEAIRSDEQLSARFFQVAGHTDSQPLQGGQFKDNWGLSAMRARQVLVYLIAPLDAKVKGGGLRATQLHAAGYGETDPVAPNQTPADRQRNRRVEMVLMPNVEEMLDLKSLL